MPTYNKRDPEQSKRFHFVFYTKPFKNTFYLEMAG